MNASSVLRSLRRKFPAARYVETARGYRFGWGPLSLTESTFLLLAATIVGLGAGFGAVGFRYLISGETNVANGVVASWFGFLGGAKVIAVLIIGGVVTSLIVSRFAKEAKGHGVPEVMAAVALRGGIMRPRVIAVKSIASATCSASAEAAGARARDPGFFNARARERRRAPCCGRGQVRRTDSGRSASLTRYGRARGSSCGWRTLRRPRADGVVRIEQIHRPSTVTPSSSDTSEEAAISMADPATRSSP